MDEKTTDSVFAIKQYIAKNKSNADRHEANVLVHAERKDFGWGKRFVSATVNQDVGQVIIEDLCTIYGGCMLTLNQEFVKAFADSYFR